MAGPGGGPSRRSHTKSRKGCKTCKKRHIRCDETFPQCRNCTKHQVRCDYMDNPTAAAPDSPKGSQSANLLWTPEIERSIDRWQQTGEFPFPELVVYPQPHWQSYQKTDLRLIHNLASISNGMIRSKTSRLTIWTDCLPKFLSLAASHPFVMHALLAFSASHLSWVATSPETKQLGQQHGSVAFKGLQDAIASFSRANSDAALAASMLLSWQATDWRAWAPLMATTKTIITAMQQWRHESIFAKYVTEHAAIPTQNFTNVNSHPTTPETHREHQNTLQHVLEAIQRLKPYVSNQGQEGRWLEQLKSYVERLRSSNPPQTSMEQFNQLYPLRKWLFWVPISLLSSSRNDINVLIVLAHFYAVALALEPLFPDVGTAFCANVALTPLEEVINILDSSLQATAGFGQSNPASIMLMEFPRESAINFRSRKEWSVQQIQSIPAIPQAPYGLDSINIDFSSLPMQDYNYGPSLSPAFAPSPLQLTPSTNMVSGQRSPYLEVPYSTIDAFQVSAYSTPLTSPSIPALGYAQEEQMYGHGMAFGFSGGFVATPTIWT
ncbi:hypothetical protein M501DRAFT_925839 [Patellaria atrata CBS 101060]|uniref:Zn(2)-C6 fungal-type domain-containing protein n=1 Tax=Patellaria atrata CBS 101060 TaxID=1346257 RepID=A0A9P4SIT9_9PEZI|nr:hypothetical protein M501DRAFT_925839 [Patellaria atrata CBS 101060]